LFSFALFPAQSSVAHFSVDGTDFERKRRAVEEQYFANLAEEQRKKYAEKLHEKELRQLLQVLPPVSVVRSAFWWMMYSFY
jgi:hypothetical protein